MTRIFKSFLLKAVPQLMLMVGTTIERTNMLHVVLSQWTTASKRRCVGDSATDSCRFPGSRRLVRDLCQKRFDRLGDTCHRWEKHGDPNFGGFRKVSRNLG
ncbi:hypothetical protein AMTR_s00138p00067190 [Amborella trichopoda]|uniref:Uncharacterized protein n=1 Tax=Amborella trichopoda TaxID=13333 RepID=W1NEL7_AMBTC|nr:hypothetical protein AMTR_s00138p00067190 [Amborella trichopoda]